MLRITMLRISSPQDSVSRRASSIVPVANTVAEPRDAWPQRSLVAVVRSFAATFHPTSEREIDMRVWAGGGESVRFSA